MIDKNSKIFLAGDRSQIAKDLKKILIQNGYENIIGCNTSNLDLRDASSVDNFFREQKPNVVFIFAARIEKTFSEIKDNPFALLNDNLFISLNLINSCIRYNVEKAIYFSSDIVFPFFPDGREIDENQILKGHLKMTREPYSLAKLTAAKLCSFANISLKTQKFITLFPCHVYGNFSKGFVFQILQDFLNAKKKKLSSVTLWGSEDLKYKFIHSRDLANAAFLVMNHKMKYDCYIASAVNQVTKGELASIIAKATNYTGKIIFDSEYKLESGLNTSSKRLRDEGWDIQVALEDGIKELMNWYKLNRL